MTAAGSRSPGFAAARSPPRRTFWRPGPVWLIAPGLAFLAVFFLLPVLRLLAMSLQDPATGALSFETFRRIATTPVYVRVLSITFRIAAETSLFSIILGYPLAYWLAALRENVRNRLALLVLVPFWTGYLVKAFAWMTILGRNGVINQSLIGSGLASERLELINNEFGVMVGMVHVMTPLAVVTMLPVMLKIDRRLIQAAQTLGATPAQSFWLIYFKLSLPGVTAGGLLVFISSLGSFIMPALLGGPRQTMLAQLIMTEVQELMNWAFAGALAAMMLGTALVSVWIYDRLFGISSLGGEASASSNRHGLLRLAGSAGRGVIATASVMLSQMTHRLIGPRGARLVLPSISIAVLAFLSLPTLLVIPIGFTTAQFIDFPPPALGLRWFLAYFHSPVWIAATVRSFGVASATALIAMILGGMAALALAHSRTRWSAAIFAFFLAPMIVPRIIVAVGMFYFFAQFGLVATDLALIIGHTVLALPFAFVTIASVLKSYDWSLDEAAAVLGANRLKTVFLITVPLVRGGLAAAALFAFVTSLDELTVAIFVSGGIKTTLPKQMWDEMTLQLTPMLASVSVVILVMVSAILLIAERLRRSP